MKFKDIKVGDTVFVEKSHFVQKEWLSFFLPERVNKVFAYSFETDRGNIFLKENGCHTDIENHFFFCYKEGDVNESGKVVKDNMKEYSDFLTKKNLKKNLQKKIQEFNVLIGSNDFTIDLLKKITIGISLTHVEVDNMIKNLI